MLDDLLTSIGRLQTDDLITFEVFARCVALLLEENAEKAVSTSSQQNEDQEGELEDDGYGQQLDNQYGEEDPYYDQQYGEELMQQ